MAAAITRTPFQQLGSDLRPGYESEESQRLAREGPRCKVTDQSTFARSLNKGDKLEVVYLLENNYPIDIVKVVASGNDL
jgi:hypothetical protein